MNVQQSNWARRGTHFLVMGLGAFLAHFNSRYGWVMPPEYNRMKGFWLGPFMPALNPYLPVLVPALGAALLVSAAYCAWRYTLAAKVGGSAA